MRGQLYTRYFCLNDDWCHNPLIEKAVVILPSGAQLSLNLTLLEKQLITHLVEQTGFSLCFITDTAILLALAHRCLDRSFIKRQNGARIVFARLYPARSIRLCWMRTSFSQWLPEDYKTMDNGTKNAA